MTRIILGSQSPRRKEIMSHFSLPFEQVSPPFIEETIPFKGNPIEYVTTLCRGKAESLHRTYPTAIVLTADTVVYLEGKVYNKPGDYEEAVRFITEFAGKWQSVYTGVTVMQGHTMHTAVEETRILMNNVSPEQIHFLLDKISWKDKAGGFTIQGAGNLLVRKIEGCYNNVTGLPVNTVRELLLRVGIDLWHYIK